MDTLKEKNIVIFSVIIVLISIITNSCGDTNNGDDNTNDTTNFEIITVEEGETYLIQGNITKKNTGFIMKPGSIIRFETLTVATIGGDVHEAGILKLEENSYFFAEGTETKSIEFLGEKFPRDYIGGYIICNLNSNVDSTYFKNCNLNNINLSLWEDIIVMNNKFDSSGITVGAGNPIIKSNSFYNSNIHIDGDTNTQPLIEYNYFKEGISNYAITMESYCVPAIRFNNIINYNIAIYRVGYAKPTINENYIANCNNILGVDTTGIQSFGVIYENPRTEPIPNAGKM